MVLLLSPTSKLSGSRRLMVKLQLREAAPMARSSPTLIYFRPADRRRLEAIALLRSRSLSYCVAELVRDTFAASFGSSADPDKVLVTYTPLLAQEPIVTQRATRRKRSTQFTPTTCAATAVDQN